MQPEWYSSLGHSTEGGRGGFWDDMVVMENDKVTYCINCACERYKPSDLLLQHFLDGHSCWRGMDDVIRCFLSTWSDRHSWVRSVSAAFAAENHGTVVHRIMGDDEVSPWQNRCDVLVVDRGTDRCVACCKSCCDYLLLPILVVPKVSCCAHCDHFYKHWRVCVHVLLEYSFQGCHLQEGKA